MLTDQLRTLSSLSSRDIAKRVLGQHMLFKGAGQIFLERAPDDEVARFLVDAFSAGTSPPWMTAFLLGCLRADCGYDTVRAILLEAPGALAESYAGVAMARIRGTRARDDLVALMRSETQLRSREGAAWGLAELRDPLLIPVVYVAYRERQVRKDAAGAIIRSLGASTHTIAQWLQSEDTRDRELGVEIAWLMTSELKNDAELRRAMKTALSSVPLSPAQRKRIEAAMQPGRAR